VEPPTLAAKKEMMTSNSNKASANRDKNKELATDAKSLNFIIKREASMA
jgi:hypothetical protein